MYEIRACKNKLNLYLANKFTFRLFVCMGCSMLCDIAKVFSGDFWLGSIINFYLLLLHSAIAATATMDNTGSNCRKKLFFGIRNLFTNIASYSSINCARPLLQQQQTTTH